jgi:hypothetical protein
MAKRGRPSKAGKREPNGRPQRDFKAEREFDAQENNLRARCWAIGWIPTPANLFAMRAPMAGCNAGRAIMQYTTDASLRADLFAAVTHMRRVQVAYDRALGAPSRNAKCLQILLPVDEMHADATTPPIDTRTDEERVRSATSAYMAIQGWLGYVDNAAASECKAVCIEDARVRDKAGLMLALAAIADGCAGRKLVWRGR